MPSDSASTIKDALLLKIFIGERDKHEGTPLFEWIVRQAQQAGLSGATVFRGILGFGAHTKMHSAKLLDLSVDLPLVVEIVDEEEKIRGFLSILDGAIKEGAVTIVKAEVRVYRTTK